MKDLERIVRTFYEGLEEGKILGRKCTRCGAVEFPPVIACNTCSCPETEWVELSGEGKLLEFILPSAHTSKPENKPFEPYCYACIELKEGTRLNAIVCGIPKKRKAEITAKLPLPIKARIFPRDGFKTVVFDLVEE